MTDNRGSSPPAGDATLDPPPTGDGAPPVATSPGRYRIDGELGRGGLGRVLLAYDRVLDRPVALKTLLVDSPTARARFAREATITARLQHPAIVPVYDAGIDEGGAPYHAMPVVSGSSLLSAIARTRTLDERLTLLPHVQTVADAIAYAHSRGVIHRDIKPSNVLIGPFGETVVIDWGIAKDVGGVDEGVAAGGAPASAELTSVGAVVGTPAYMAPEQARGDEVDKRIDVYALGALLYHVLAGAPPLAGTEDDALERRRRGEVPPALATLVSGLPPDLDRIARKAMSSDPGARYASAVEVADDLRRFQTGQLISAHEYGRIELLRRWLKRHATAVVAASVGVLTLAILSGYGVSRILRERDAAEQARSEALARAEALLLANADSQRLRDPTAAIAWLGLYPDGGRDPERRFELALATAAEPIACAGLRHEGDGIALASLSLPGGRAITFGWDALVVWSLAGLPNGVPTASFRERQASPVTSFALLHVDGEPSAQLAIGHQSGDVATFDVDTRQRQSLARLNGAVATLVASRGRPVLAAATERALTRLAGAGMATRDDHAVAANALVATRDGTLLFGTKDSLWQWREAEPPKPLLPLAEPITALVVAERSQRAFAGDAAGTLLVFAVGADGTREQRSVAAGVTALALTRDERHLVLGDKAGQVWLLDPIRDAPGVPLFQHDEAVLAVAMQPGTDAIFSTSSDGRMASWSPSTGASRVFRGHETLIGPMSFSDDGALVSTIGMDGLVRLWAAAPTAPHVVTRPAAATHVAFSGDGRYLASDGEDGSVLLLDLATGDRREERVHEGRVYGVEAAPSGSLFVTAGHDGRVVVWDAAKQTHDVFGGHEGRVRKVQLGPGGRAVYSAGNDGTIRRVDRGTRVSRVLHRFRGRALDVEALAGESVVLANGDDGTLVAATLSTGESRVVASGLGSHASAAFELGRVGDEAILVCRGPRRIERYAATGALDGGWDLDVDVGCTRLAGRGRRVVFPSETTLWAFDGDGPPERIGQAAEAIHTLALGPGDTVATASLDGTVTVWQLDPAEARLVRATVVARHDGAAFGVGISLDGARVASAGYDQRVRIASLESASWVPRRPAELGAWLEGLAAWRVEAERVVPESR